MDEVYAAAIAGARGVCEFDFAAVATFDSRRGSHTIRCVVGEAAEHLLGTTHKDPSSIASMAAKNKLALPAGIADPAPLLSVDGDVVTVRSDGGCDPGSKSVVSVNIVTGAMTTLFKGTGTLIPYPNR